MKRIKIFIFSGSISLLLALMIVLTANGFLLDLVNEYRGYDYGPKRSSQYDWIGPKPGEIIDTRFLAREDGTPLDSSVTSEIVLLTVVDPECPAGKVTREQMRFLQDNVSKEGIDYYLLSFSPKISPSDLSTYVASLALTTPSVSWSNGIDSVIPSLSRIVTPSHILIDSKGIVLRTFAGTNADKRIRDRMVRQVLREVIDEKSRQGR